MVTSTFIILTITVAIATAFPAPAPAAIEPASHLDHLTERGPPPASFVGSVDGVYYVVSVMIQ